MIQEQVDRYFRHIIMPEIGEPGQKKLLESRIVIYSDSVLHSAPLLYYLAASGVGHISCSFQECTGFEELFSNIHDLNSSVVVDLVEAKHNDQENPSVSIIFGNPVFVTNLCSEYKFLPLIAAVYNSWKGIIKSILNHDDYRCFTGNFKRENSNLDEEAGYIDGTTSSAGLAGAISAVEAVKLCLNMESHPKELLYFDLFNMEFRKTGYDVLHLLYQASNMKKTSVPRSAIKESRVLIVGTGGLGSPAAYGLAMSGIGTIGLVDCDSVELSNLNRQILHSYSRIGMPKVQSAEFFLKKLNGDLKIETYHTKLSKENAMDIISKYDVVVDGVDNFPTRYLLNDVCHFCKKPLVEAGVLRFDGLGMTIVPNEDGPCYRCIFPKLPEEGSMPSFSESGILGPVPGILGFIQSAEVIKLLSGTGRSLKNRMIFVDTLDTDYRVINLNKNPKCPLCGTAPTITILQEYDL